MRPSAPAREGGGFHQGGNIVVKKHRATIHLEYEADDEEDGEEWEVLYELLLSATYNDLKSWDIDIEEA